MAEQSSIRPFCPVHEETRRDIERIEGIQRDRPCGRHDERLTTAEKANKDQWKEINKLKIIVYMGAGGAGALSFLGSIIGSWIKGH